MLLHKFTSCDLFNCVLDITWNATIKTPSKPAGVSKANIMRYDVSALALTGSY